MSIWLDNKFVPYKKVVFANFNIDLSPYHYKASEDALKTIGPLLEQLGCTKEERQTYVNVLRKLKEKNGSRPVEDLVRDRQLAFNSC